MNSDHLRQRLAELKKASFDLKERVGKEPNIDRGLVTALLASAVPDKQQSPILEVTDPHKDSASNIGTTMTKGSMVMALFGNTNTDKSVWSSHNSDKKQGPQSVQEN